MKPVLIALTVLTLSVGTAYAADFGNKAELGSALADWHGAAAPPYYASYADASLTQVVDGYWAALGAFGYDGTVTGGTTASTTYTFGGATGALTATFTQAGEVVVATLSRDAPGVALVNAPD